MSQVDYADVQGLVRFGYGHMTSASYALVRVNNADAAKAWLRSAPITTAVAQKPAPNTAMNIAFTAPGLRALGVSESIIPCFSHEFRGGMGHESRARQLGDVGKNAPSNWTWGNYERERHALVMLFAEQGQLDSLIQTARDRNWSKSIREDRLVWYLQSRRRRSARTCARKRVTPRLNFICLSANVSRQFEFLQNAWVANTEFSGVSGKSDPASGQS